MIFYRMSTTVFRLLPWACTWRSCQSFFPIRGFAAVGSIDLRGKNRPRPAVWTIMWRSWQGCAHLTTLTRRMLFCSLSRHRTWRRPCSPLLRPYPGWTGGCLLWSLLLSSPPAMLVLSAISAWLGHMPASCGKDGFYPVGQSLVEEVQHCHGEGEGLHILQVLHGPSKY